MSGEGGRGPAPLILTALLPDDLHRWATSLRDAHYPPGRNHLEAHVTLFRVLPPSSEAEVRALCERGVREITLIGQNVNTYIKAEIDSNAKLVKAAGLSPTQ